MIFNIYKPKDLSSFSIVKKIKNITKEKVGHSGTLDPFADGVLVLGVGKSTKKLSNIIQFDKTYEGKGFIFPAFLKHVVYPFYTTDLPRITMSGNIYAV